MSISANTAKSLEPQKMAKALEGMHLPPEVALMPGAPFYRASDHQLIPSLFVGQAQGQGSDPEDLFHVDEVVDGAKAAPQDTGCQMKW